MTLPKNADGTLASFAWPGGYPIIYLTKENENLCPECANKEVSNIAREYIHWEGEPINCEECNCEIESAYGVPENDE